MRRLSLSLLVLVTLFSNLPAQTDQSGWITLAPEGAGFSVLMPGKATESTNKKASFTLYSFNITAGRATYIASYSDYAPGKLDPATALTANRDKFNKSLDAKLMSSREITTDGQTGLEFTSETPAANVKSQLFVVGNRLYQTVAFVFRDADETRNVDRFFESFKFIKANPTPTPGPI